MDEVVKIIGAGEACHQFLKFWCPGCEGIHLIPITTDKALAQFGIWLWNGDKVRPTVTPSIQLIGWTSGMPEVKSQPDCHSNITDGIIDFCPDSSHPLKGMKIPLEKIHTDALGS